MSEEKPRERAPEATQTMPPETAAQAVACSAITSAQPTQRPFAPSHTASASWSRRALSLVSDTIIPPVCLSCHEPLAAHDALCPACWCGIDFICEPVCNRLGLPMPFATGPNMVSAAAAARPPKYNRARAVARYDGVMRQLIHDLKFHDTHNARKLFGGWMTQAGRELLRETDLLVPVPLARFKLFTRRFNQSAILARQISKETGIDWLANGLRRTRATKTQIGLTYRQRRQNVRGAFKVLPKARAAIIDRRILLIDDVITTGATVEACANTLLAAGAANVDVLALALVTDAAPVMT